MTTRCAQPLPAECILPLCSQVGVRLLLSIYEDAFFIPHQAD